MNLVLPTATTTLVPIQAGKAALLQNNSGVSIYIGGSDVTADTETTGGYVLADGAELAISNGGGIDPLIEPLYATHADGGSINLTILLL